MLNHVLLEIFCLKETDDNHDKPLPQFCPAVDTPGYHCLYHKCSFLDFTSCENTLCYINENSEMEEGILFGGEMESSENEPREVELWKNVSVDAVNRAYETYMQQRGTHMEYELKSSLGSVVRAEKECDVYCPICHKMLHVQAGRVIPRCCGKVMEVLE